MPKQHLTAIAISKSGIEGWEPFYWRAVSKSGFLVRGGIPRPITQGPRRGQKTWRDVATTTVALTRADFDKAKAQYIADTGNCPFCVGTGRSGPSKCRPCAGSGKAVSNMKKAA